MGIIWRRTARLRRRQVHRKRRAVVRRWDQILGRMVERLEQARQAEGLSQRRFAARLGVPAPTYHRMVATGRPNVEAIYGAALAFGINPRWVLDGSGSQKIRVGEWYEPDQPKEGATP